MAGTTNLLQFNPDQTNQETDATYLADSNRSGGFGTDAIWPSVLANKTLNLLSNYLFALFTAFAQKGFTTNDDNVPLLIAQCANFLTSADILPAIMPLAFSPTPAFNFGASNAYQMTLTGNITASTASGVTPGQLIAFYFLQDSVGGRTVSYPGAFFGTLQPDPTPNSLSVLLFRVDVSGNASAATPLISNTTMFSLPLNTTEAFVSGLLKSGSLTLTAPGTAGQVLANVGGLFVPRGTPLTSNANGKYRISPEGLIECWGTVNAAATGNQFSTASITFPFPFTSIPFVQVTGTALPSPAAHPNDCAEVQLGSKSTTGATVNLQCSTPTGGGGADFDNSIPIDFYAAGT